MKTRLNFLAFAAVCGLVAPVAFSQSQQTQKSATEQRKTAQVDRTYASEIHVINLAEVKLGELAKSKGQSTGVKNYGAMLVKDHQANDDKLKDLAKKKNVKLESKEASMKERDLTAIYEKLQKDSAATFDASFAKEMVSGHEAAIQLVTDASAKETDTQLKSYLDETLPGLRTHLEDAKKLPTMSSH